MSSSTPTSTLGDDEKAFSNFTILEELDNTKKRTSRLAKIQAARTLSQKRPSAKSPRKLHGPEKPDSRTTLMVKQAKLTSLKRTTSSWVSEGRYNYRNAKRFNTLQNVDKIQPHFNDLAGTAATGKQASKRVGVRRKRRATRRKQNRKYESSKGSHAKQNFVSDPNVLFVSLKRLESMDTTEVYIKDVDSSGYVPASSDEENDFETGPLKIDEDIDDDATLPMRSSDNLCATMEEPVALVEEFNKEIFDCEGSEKQDCPEDQLDIQTSEKELENSSSACTLTSMDINETVAITGDIKPPNLSIECRKEAVIKEEKIDNDNSILDKNAANEDGLILLKSLHEKLSNQIENLLRSDILSPMTSPVYADTDVLKVADYSTSSEDRRYSRSRTENILPPKKRRIVLTPERDQSPTISENSSQTGETTRSPPLSTRKKSDAPVQKVPPIVLYSSDDESNPEVQKVFADLLNHQKSISCKPADEMIVRKSLINKEESKPNGMSEINSEVPLVDLTQISARGSPATTQSAPNSVFKCQHYLDRFSERQPLKPNRSPTIRSEEPLTSLQRVYTSTFGKFESKTHSDGVVHPNSVQFYGNRVYADKLSPQPSHSLKHPVSSVYQPGPPNGSHKHPSSLHQPPPMAHQQPPVALQYPNQISELLQYYRSNVYRKPYNPPPVYNSGYTTAITEKASTYYHPRLYNSHVSHQQQAAMTTTQSIPSTFSQVNGYYCRPSNSATEIPASVPPQYFFQPQRTSYPPTALPIGQGQNLNPYQVNWINQEKYKALLPQFYPASRLPVYPKHERSIAEYTRQNNTSLPAKRNFHHMSAQYNRQIPPRDFAINHPPGKPLTMPSNYTVPTASTSAGRATSAAKRVHADQSYILPQTQMLLAKHAAACPGQPSAVPNQSILTHSPFSAFRVPKKSDVAPTSGVLTS